MTMKRGVLIVLEGCDKAGKSTQSKMLLEAMQKLGKCVQLMRFPERSTEVGQIIDRYLTRKTDLNGETIHLLFAANRREFQTKIKETLLKGESIIVDRYAFSGVAFSAAKGLNLSWCKNTEVGLPKPDVVIFLNVSKEVASERGGYGEERYENLEFQEKVKQKYMELYDADYWKTVETGRTMDLVHKDILSHAMNALETKQNVAPEGLWVETQRNSP